MNASDLRHLSIEAATCLICANGSSCSDPDECLREAARYVDKANDLLGADGIRVETVRTGEVTAFRVTETGHIRVWTADGGTDLIEGIEVLKSW